MACDILMMQIPHIHFLVTGYYVGMYGRLCDDPKQLAKYQYFISPKRLLL